MLSCLAPPQPFANRNIHCRAPIRRVLQVGRTLRPDEGEDVVEIHHERLALHRNNPSHLLPPTRKTEHPPRRIVPSHQGVANHDVLHQLRPPVCQHDRGAGCVASGGQHGELALVLHPAREHGVDALALIRPHLHALRRRRRLHDGERIVELEDHAPASRRAFAIRPSC